MVGRFANRLKNDGDCSLDRIGIGDRKRDPFIKLSAELEDDKLAGLSRFSDFRSFNLHLKHCSRQLFFRNDFVHTRFLRYLIRPMKTIQ